MTAAPVTLVPVEPAADLHPDDATRIEAAVALATTLVREAATRDAHAGRRARKRRARMAMLVRDSGAKDVTMTLTDEVTRVTDPARAARLFARLSTRPGTAGLPWTDRMLLRIGGVLAPRLPRIIMPLVTRQLRQETRGIILPAEDPGFARHVQHRRSEHIRCNINVLGESILGEDEARTRLDAVASRLVRGDIDYVSVKISAISSEVRALSFAATVDTVSERLRILYRVAMQTMPAKFVNLDMEEYRDLELTLAVFRSVLEEDEFRSLEAGIVLQAYLPDAHDAARSLCEWARTRRVAGGGRIKVRLVKGANLAMEQVEAELHGWEQAPYGSKAEVDASYKALLDVVLDARYDDSVRVGLASHNLFDVAWGLGLRAELAARGVGERIEIEMLEGMAESQAEAVRDAAGGLLLYAPVVAHDDFAAAIAYLVRRLDENTAPENFLRNLFDLAPGNAVFEGEAARFRAAVAARHTIATSPRRTQDRRIAGASTPAEAPFANEPDTDFALRANRTWIGRALADWRPPTAPVGPRVDGAWVDAPVAADVALTSSPWASYPVRLADVALVDRAVAVARDARAAWSARPAAERAAIVHAVGDVIARHRGETLATMAHDAGKTIPEGDPEVSEAADFARYYAASVADLPSRDGIASHPLGTVVVAPPWNFPYAIAMGGVLAALAAGNTVILKPAPQAILTGLLVAKHCWEAGVPTDVLQFLPCPDDDAGRRLITHPDVDAVILTGAHATAELFLEWKPTLRLHAETSGKNSMVITAVADVDLAIKDLVKSAFGHAGQKCSAASLAIVEESLYDSPAFRARLADAVRSLRVGPGYDLRTDVGPLIDPPSGNLLRALTILDDGESWLVEPRQIGDDPRLWSPGVRLGVVQGSWFQQNECFGPVLGLVRARELDHAIAIQNDSRYGLTAGIHSLDADEIAKWTEQVEAGNLYVNRGITGAIVRRQPFGGWKQSVVGPTVKAGGPQYVRSLRRWNAVDGVSIDDAVRSFSAWAATERLAERDPSGLRSESNVLRWRPLPNGVAVRVGKDAAPAELALATAAARAVGTAIDVSLATEDSDEDFAARVATLTVDRVRVLGTVGDSVRRAVHAAAIPLDDAPVTAEAAIELPRWLREQAVSTTRHRHGHIR